jgi:DsbC/DsbD-like thiol-disulfide interchange protein
MFLTGPFHQRSHFLVLAGWCVLLVIGLVFSSSSVLAFQSLEEFSRSRDKISPVNVTAMADPIGAAPGKAFDLYLLVNLSEGWHIYALEEKSQGESLATEIRFEENVFRATGEWMEPKPTIALDGALDKVVKVHSDSVRFRRNMTVPGDLKPGVYAISGEIEYRACDNKICSLPRKVDFQTRFQVSGEDSDL